MDETDSSSDDTGDEIDRYMTFFNSMFTCCVCYEECYPSEISDRTYDHCGMCEGRICHSCHKYERRLPVCANCDCHDFEEGTYGYDAIRGVELEERLKGGECINDDIGRWDEAVYAKEDFRFPSTLTYKDAECKRDAPHNAEKAARVSSKRPDETYRTKAVGFDKCKCKVSCSGCECKHVCTPKVVCPKCQFDMLERVCSESTFKRLQYYALHKDSVKRAKALAAFRLEERETLRKRARVAAAEGEQESK